MLTSILLYLCLELPHTETILENSDHVSMVMGLKSDERYYYLADMTGMQLHNSEGRYLKTLIQKGGGPEELNGIWLVFKVGDDIWASDRSNAILIRDGSIIEKMKVPAMLLGANGGNKTIRSIRRKTSGATLAYVLSGKKREHFFEASDEMMRNHLKVGEFYVFQDEQHLAYGDSLSNKFEIKDLTNGETKTLTPDLAGINRYDIKEHGTTSLKFKPSNFQRFVGSFDHLAGASTCFWLRYKGNKYLVLTWYSNARRAYSFQIFDLNGTLLSVGEHETPPRDYDNQGNFLFIKRSEDENHHLTRLPISSFLGN